MSHENIEQTLDEPTHIDPQDKIKTRYPDNFEEIEETYVDLCCQYQDVMRTIMNNSAVNAAQHSKVNCYLRTTSRQLLSQHQNDARLAFNQLVGDVEAMLHTHRFAYDQCAIQYYLYFQLVACNIFPLPRIRRVDV